jgi:uncharacterized membrane protein
MNDLYQTVFGFCSFICHQDPARSFALLGRQLPLCSRCLGLHIFLILGLIFGAVILRGRMVPNYIILFFLFLSIVSGVDAILEGSLLEVGNLFRFATGCISGISLGFLIGHFLTMKKGGSTNV